MGFVNILPPIKLLKELSTTADSWSAGQIPPNVPGAISFHKTSADKWSLLKYYQANATIASIGLGLVRPAAATAGYVLQTAATTDVNSYALKGISAAVVNNTGYFSFAYIGGYVPDIVFGSAASGVAHGLSGSNAGHFTQYSSAGSTIAINTKPFFFPVTAFDVTTIAGSTASGWISPILF